MEEEENAKKERKRKEIGTWEGAVVDRHQRRLHKTYEGVEVGSYDPELLIHASCLVQFRTEFRKLLLHRHTNKSSPRKNTLLCVRVSLSRAQRRSSLLKTGGYLLDTHYPNKIPVRANLRSKLFTQIVVLDCCSLFLIG
jgi:hypothetical protein